MEYSNPKHPPLSDSSTNKLRSIKLQIIFTMQNLSHWEPLVLALLFVQEPFSLILDDPSTITVPTEMHNKNIKQ